MNAGAAAADRIAALGFHLGVSPDWAVTALSANIGGFLPGSGPATLGTPLTGLLAENAIHDIRNRMALLRGDDAIERLANCPVIDGQRFDLSIYRIGDGFGIDGEPCDRSPLGNVTGMIEGMLTRLPQGDDLEELCVGVARQLRSVTGFDNVCVHLGDRLGGQSARPAAVPPPLPPSAFVAADVAADPVVILAEDGAEEAAVRSDLRAPGPAEVAWLRQNGARAAMVLALPGGEEGRRFASCLHSSPRHVGLQRRGLARLFAAIAALRIDIAELRSR